MSRRNPGIYFTLPGQVIPIHFQQSLRGICTFNLDQSTHPCLDDFNNILISLLASSLTYNSKHSPHSSHHQSFKKMQIVLDHSLSKIFQHRCLQTNKKQNKTKLVSLP